MAACETAEPDNKFTLPESSEEEEEKEDDIVTILPSSRPNIVLMLADDMGFDDMSYRGNQSVKTPYLDSLATISTRFENFYVHSVSAPTRASLLTGRHFLRCGISGLHAGRDFLNLDEVTIADALSSAGYKTGMWGKWHSGKSNGYFPWQRGFDEAYMASLYHHNYNDGEFKGEYEGKIYNGETLSFSKSDGVWTDAKMTDMAIDFMTRNKGNNFFAYIPFLTCHESWAAPDEYVDEYLQMGQSENFATLNGMLGHMDYQVGRVLAAVEDLGIADNTIIIFMSDNGPNYNKTLLTADEWTQRNPSGYSGSKSKNLENGIHSPLFIYWKGRTVAMDNNSVLGVCDIFPTLCDLASANIPSTCKPLDGTSFYNIISSPSLIDLSRTLHISHWAPFINGECYDEGALTEDIIASIDPELQHIGIRRGYDKLLLNEYNEDAISFWDLKSDPTEQKNLYSSGSSTEKSNALAYKSELISWYNDVLNDEGSLTITTFQIGDPDLQYFDVFCYAPIAFSSSLTNESLTLSGFQNAGDSASYSVNVLTEGSYDIRIYSSSKAVGDEIFTITTTTSDGVSVSYEATFNSNSYSSKWCAIDLDSSINTISIQLKNTTSNEFALKYLRLEYLD